MIAIALLTVAQGAVSLPVGETLRVELKDVSTTGYRWEARDFDGALVSLEASAVVPSPAGGGAGSAGTSSARAPPNTPSSTSSWPGRGKRTCRP
jgi:predicted secreted protein